MVGVGDPVDVRVLQLAVRPVDHPPELAGVDEEHLAAAVAKAAVPAVAGEEPETRRDRGRVEELARQGHHAVHQLRLQQAPADLQLGLLAGAHRPVGEHEARHAGRGEVVDHVLHPGEVGVAPGGRPEPPSLVLGQPLRTPVAHVEGRVGEDEVGLEVGVLVVVEGVAVGDLARYPANREVHPGQPPGRVVRFLAVDRDAGCGAGRRPRPLRLAGRRRGPMSPNELDRLHEHARRAAAGVVDPSLERLDHLDEQLDDTARSVELAAPLPLGVGEHRQEVLVDATEHVLGPGRLVAHADVAHEVDDLSQAHLVERLAGVVLRQHVPERRVVPLDGRHRVVHQPTDPRLLGLTPEVAPAGRWRNPEDVLGSVLVGIVGVGTVVALQF